MDRIWNFVWSRLEAIGWLEFLLLLFLASVTFILWQANRSSTSKIDLDDLFVDPVTGKLVLEKFILLGAFVFSSWGLIALITKGVLSEWYFVGYMAAWVASRGTYMWLTSKGAQNVPPSQ
jgi:hypothetical protein